MQYIDGIDNFSYRDGIVQGTLVILENKAALQGADISEPGVASGFTAKPVDSIAMPLRAVLQIHSALGDLIDKLVENQVIKRSEQTVE